MSTAVAMSTAVMNGRFPTRVTAERATAARATAARATAAHAVAARAAMAREAAPVRSAEPRLRLTKRGRVVLTTLVALPLIAAALVFGLNGGMATATSTTSSTAFQYVTVEAGQSLWQLALQLAPSADPREVISDVVHLNQLSSPDVQVGQRLAIPLRYSN